MLFNAYNCDLDFSGDNPYKPMSADSSLQEVINAMAHGLSRVPLLDAQGHIVKMISQSNVISFIAKHIDGIGAKGSQTLRETGIGTRTLVMARLEERAIDAFAKIVDRKISHVALIDRAGHLAGNLSVKDLKAAMDFSRLLYTVNDYVNIIRRENLKSVHPSIHANDTDTVAKTIVRLATIRIHRMYLTSIPPDQLEQTSTYAPTGVISLRDVLTLFAAK
jgi:CBS domain-containing protein